MIEQHKNEPTHEYQLIDWSKPAPIIPPKPVKLTITEAQIKNRALRMNCTTLRYVKTEL